MEDGWEYQRAVRPLSTLWIRDHAGRWHPTCDYAPRPLGEGGEVTLELAIAPPLEAGAPEIDLMAAGPSAQVQARLKLRLDVESMAARQAGCLALAGLLDIPGHAGRPAIHRPPITRAAGALQEAAQHSRRTTFRPFRR